MKNLILILFSTLIISCHSNEVGYKERDNKVKIEENSLLTCNEELSPTIEIWSHNGNGFIIGNWEKREDKYEKSKGWNLDEFPFPKKFDIKLTITNNAILYDDSNYKIKDWYLTVSYKFKVGQNQDAFYPLNSTINDNREILNSKLITDSDFIKNGIKTDHIEIWLKGIEFEHFYKKYSSRNLFINQLIFEMHLINKATNNNCNFEYIFPMAEMGEP